MKCIYFQLSYKVPSSYYSNGIKAKATFDPNKILFLKQPKYKVHNISYLLLQLWMLTDVITIHEALDTKAMVEARRKMNI